jgi:YebC/PmpR family DNA-binding regulatory protein
MGRAYEVRKASIQKTGATKARLYSNYAKEIYLAAKNGGTNIEANLTLRRLVEKAKVDQVPGDLVKRAIDKVSSGLSESYDPVRYEIFGPGGSLVILDCLTDNVNRTLSDIRPSINKTGSKIGAMGSVAYMYDHLSIITVNSNNTEEVFEYIIENDIELVDIEENDGKVVVYGNPKDLYLLKETIATKFEVEHFEISMLPKEQITLENEEKELFTRLITTLEEVEDVQHIYHNVIL